MLLKVGLTLFFTQVATVEPWSFTRSAAPFTVSMRSPGEQVNARQVCVHKTR